MLSGVGVLTHLFDHSDSGLRGIGPATRWASCARGAQLYCARSDSERAQLFCRPRSSKGDYAAARAAARPAGDGQAPRCQTVSAAAARRAHRRVKRRGTHSRAIDRLARRVAAGACGSCERPPPRGRVAEGSEAEAEDSPPWSTDRPASRPHVPGSGEAAGSADAEHKITLAMDRSGGADLARHPPQDCEGRPRRGARTGAAKVLLAEQRSPDVVNRHDRTTSSGRRSSSSPTCGS